MFLTFSVAVRFCARYNGAGGSKPEMSVTTISLDPGDGSTPIMQALDLSVGNQHCIDYNYTKSCDCNASIEIKNNVSNFKENIQVWKIY